MSERSFAGGCHCGAVRYEARVDITQGVTCNCSRCSKLGWIVTFTPAPNFKLLKGEDNLTEYRFNKEVIRHRFCKTCGIESFALGSMPDGSPVAAINVNCLDGVDPTTLSPGRYDGASA